MLFNKKSRPQDGENPSDAPRRQSVLGFMFKPEIGRMLSPIGAIWGTLVLTIAGVFAASGILPRNHPALTGAGGARPSLGEVLAMALRNIEFNRSNLPKILLFAAVCIGLACGVLAAMMIVLNVVIGVAHAQSGGSGGGAATGIFETPQKVYDLAYLWIDFLFLNKPLVGTPWAGGGGPTPTMTISDASAFQAGFVKVLSFYSNGVLVIAGIILLYHLTVMVAETAHHGVPFGKRASQIWAPIRLVVAIGMLVPVSDGGLNSGQYIVVQLARWGSGLASQTWNIFLEELRDQNVSLTPPRTPLVDDFAMDFIKIMACQIAWNKQLQVIDDATGGLYDLVNLYTIEPRFLSVPGDVAPGTSVSYTRIEFNYEDKKDGPCGHIVVPQASIPVVISNPTYPPPSSYTQNIYDEMYQKNINALTYALSSDKLRDVSGRVLKYLDPKLDPMPAAANSTADPADFIEEYIDNLAVTNIQTSPFWKEVVNDVIAEFGPQGWVTAGVLFNTLARVQINITSIPLSVLPSANAPDFSSPITVTGIISSHLSAINDVAENTRKAVHLLENDVLKKARIAKITGCCGATAGKSTTVAQLGLSNYKSISGPAGILLELVKFFLEQAGVWSPGHGPIYTFDKTSNPLSEMTETGYMLVNGGFNLLGYAGLALAGGAAAPAIAAAISAAGGFIAAGPFGAVGAGLTGGIVGNIAAPFVTFIGIMLIFIATAMITGGAALAFLLPLIPFIMLFFGTITWFLALLGAVASMPMFALAHLNPEGEGLPGAMARPGYFFLLDIILRPALMIIGLIAGFLLFMLSMKALNMLYMTAVYGAGSYGGSIVIIGRIFFTVIYCALAYGIANNCFKTITYFPEQALKWINAQAQPVKDIGAKGQVQSAFGKATSESSSGISGKISSGATGLGGGLGALIKP